MKRFLAAAACILALLPEFAAAQASYPSRPVRIIVPFSPGGGTDTFARVVGARLATRLGQQVIVENRAGAQGNIGTAAGARAAPDGYTLTLAYVGTLCINPHLYRNPGFDALKDFAAVTRGTLESWVLVVHPSLPVHSVKELVALAKRRPGDLAFASSASGTQLVGELFKLATKTNILHVPYKGAGPAVIDLLAGNVQMMFSNPTAAVPHVKTGRLRGLLVTGRHRLHALPDVPAAVQTGIRELDVYGWYGVVVPAATPGDIISKLNADIVATLKSPETVKRMRSLGQELSPSTAEQFQEQIRKEFDLWGKVVRGAGIKAD